MPCLPVAVRGHPAELLDVLAEEGAVRSTILKPL